MVTGSATAFGKQARGPVLLKAAQPTKHLAPLQPDQHTGVTDPRTTRLNPQEHLKTAELLLAHRHQRRCAPPGPQNPGECHLYLLEACHFYIALTAKSPIRWLLENPRAVANLAL
jgi:hypothetical protein